MYFKRLKVICIKGNKREKKEEKWQEEIRREKGKITQSHILTFKVNKEVKTGQVFKFMYKGKIITKDVYSLFIGIVPLPCIWLVLFQGLFFLKDFRNVNTKSNLIILISSYLLFYFCSVTTMFLVFHLDLGLIPYPSHPSASRHRHHSASS